MLQCGSTWHNVTVHPDCICRLHALCVCVCLTCLTLICAAWEIAWASPRRDRTKRTPKKKKNRTPRDAKQEHFWTLTHFKSFYIPSHQLHINFVRRMAPGTRPRSPPIAIQVAALGIRGDKQVKHPYENYWKNNLKNSWNDVFDCKIIQNSIAMASLNGKSQWQVSTDSWTDSI